jgi:hypothetical protein
MIYKNKSTVSLEGEIWVDVLYYEGIYSVSNLGRVKSEKRCIDSGQGYSRVLKEKILSQGHQKADRLTVVLYYNGKQENKDVGQIVWQAFNQTSTPEGKCIMHKNKIASDNRLNNLEEVTRSESGLRNFELDKVPNMQKGVQKRIEQGWKYKHGLFIDGKLVKNLCAVCSTMKPCSEFYDPQCNICKKCKNIRRKK